jgi:hypothetical protein
MLAKKKMQSERKASGTDETDIAIFVAETVRPAAAPQPQAPSQEPAEAAEPQHDPI